MDMNECRHILLMAALLGAGLLGHGCDRASVCPTPESMQVASGDGPAIAGEEEADRLDDVRREWVMQLAPIRDEQMRGLLAGAGQDTPPMMIELMAGAMTAEWTAVSNAWQHMDFLRNIQAENVAPAIRGAAFHPANEMAWFFALMRSEWTTELAELFCRESLDALPEKSIVFLGGAGSRFLLGGLRDIQGRTNMLALSQNQLVDATYLEYVQVLAPEGVWVPMADDHTAAFSVIVEDIRAGRAGPEVGVLDDETGKVNLHWPSSAMWLNGVLARLMVENNKEEYSFFVEEEEVIPWMRGFMKPAGAWLQLFPEPVETISPEEVLADIQYWENMEKRLLKRPDYIGSLWMRATWAPRRMGGASLYAHHRMWDQAEAAFKQTIRLAPKYTLAHFRLATEVYVPQNRLEEAIYYLEQVRQMDPESALCDEWIHKLRAQLFSKPLPPERAVPVPPAPDAAE